jgi:CBS domain-containing protein
MSVSKTPTEAALAPFRTCADAVIATQQGAWAMGQAASEAAWGLVSLYAQQAQLTLGWAELAGKTLATLADSKVLDDLVQANTALARAQGRQALGSASAVIERLDPERLWMTSFPIAAAAGAGRRSIEPETPEREDHMKISECMTRDVQLASPNDTIAEAARCMARIDAGILPVGDNDRLVGMITDRDIAVRAVAEGKGPDAKVSEVMNAEVMYCFDDQEVDEVLNNMGDVQVRRMPVLNRDKRLVGIVSLGDLAANSHARPAGEALSDISRPGGQHSQTAH